MAAIPVHASLAFRDDGTPFSPDYNDIYYSASGALGQARHVFLHSAGLPGRWAGRRTFSIVETGFGAGLNFLATWQSWRKDPKACRQLHFVSFEKYPLEGSDLREMLARHVEDSQSYSAAQGGPLCLELVEQLQRAWPTIITAGLHRLVFDEGRVVLTLGFGDALSLARRMRLRANAFFLDGFSPSKNPDMWDPLLFKALAKLADEGAPITTYTSAGEVRRNLIAAGFDTKRAPAYGSKREMLVGYFAPRWRVRRHLPPHPDPQIAPFPLIQQEETSPAKPPFQPPARTAMVVGAGLAGCAVAERLITAGWTVHLIDQGNGVAGGASGNPAGVFHPMITRDEGLTARLSRAGFLHALRCWRNLERSGQLLRWSANGLFQEDSDRQTGSPGLPADIVEPADLNMALAATGVLPGSEGWLFKEGGWIDPSSLCNAQLAAAKTRGDNLTCHFHRRVTGFVQDEIAGADGIRYWHALDESQGSIASAHVVVIACAGESAKIAKLHHAPTEQVRGQLTMLPDDCFQSLARPIIGGAYLTPTPYGVMTGASYDVGDSRTYADIVGHQENLQRLGQLLPDFQSSGQVERLSSRAAQLSGRVAFRCVTGDRLPMIGQLADEEAAAARAHSLKGAQPLDIPRIPGMYGAFGYGSRGLTWSAIGAELLVNLIDGTPPPLEADLIDAIDPARFLLRDLRRGKVQI